MGSPFPIWISNSKSSKTCRLKQYLYGVYQNLFDEEKQMEELYQKSAEDPDNFEKILAKAQRLQDDLDKNNFYGLQEKVGRLTDGLGFDKAQLQRSAPPAFERPARKGLFGEDAS
jgi:ATPase subunit of ABC transporter with duplicated ATPase domains